MSTKTTDRIPNNVSIAPTSTTATNTTTNAAFAQLAAMGAAYASAVANDPRTAITIANAYAENQQKTSTTTNNASSLPTTNFSFVHSTEPTSTRTQNSSLVQYLKDDAAGIADTDIGNIGYQRISPNGISSLRPEMIAVTNFSPAYLFVNQEDKLSINLTPHGTLIDVMIKALQLRHDNLASNINNINLTLNNANSIFGKMKSDFDAKYNQIDKYIKFANNIHITLDQLKNLLDFYDELKNYKIEYRLGSFSSQGAIDPNRTSLSIGTRDFITRYMKFKASDIETFTNTKLYLQMLADFKAMLETYSLELFSETDSNRNLFSDPYTIDTSYGSGVRDNRFTVRKWLKGTGETGEIVVATRQKNFDYFYNLMPIQPEERIKLLITLLSKEYRISKGLGNPEIAGKLQSEFGVSNNVGNPFDNICGSPGTTIFDNIRGDKSLASLAKIKDTKDASIDVFPFEDKYIDQDTMSGLTSTGIKNYIPGSNYLVDSIVDFASDKTVAANVNASFNNLLFNLNPINTYASDANRKLIAANDVIRGLLDANQANGGTSQLNPITMFRKILERTVMSTQGLTYQQSASTDQAAISALMKLAYIDPTLRIILFQYILLCGIVINNQKKDKKVFEDLKRELGTTAELSYMPRVNSLNGNSSVSFDSSYDFSVMIGKAATLIENYVINYLYKVFGGQSEISGPTYIGMENYAFTYSGLEGKIVGPTGIQTLSKDSGTDLVGVLLQAGDLTNILKSIVYPTDTNVPYTNLISEFINTADLFYDLASTSDFNLPGSPGSAPQTRFNFLTPSGQLLMLYETFLSVTQQYVKVDFSVDTNYQTNALLVYVNTLVQKLINDNYLNFIATNKEVANFNLASVDSRIQEVLKTSTTAPRSNTQAPPSSYLSNTFGFEFDPNTGRWQPKANIILTKTTTGQTWAVLPKIDNAKLSISTDSMAQLQKLYGTFGNVGIYQQTEKSMVSDYRAIEGILSMLTVIQKNMAAIRDLIFSTFSTAPGSINGSLITEVLQFYNAYTGEYSFFKNRAQVQIATRYFDKYKSQLENTPRIENTNIDDALRPLLAGFTPTNKERQLLFKFLGQDIYLQNNLATDRTKIISVGIPIGFSKNITERMKRLGITWTNAQTSNFHGRTNADIVNIKVYKRDYRYDEIVFKPKVYTFDLSLYQDDQEFNKFADLSDVTYESCKEYNQLYDYGNLENGLAKKYTYKSIAQNNERYRMINDDLRKKIFTNHMESYLLERYLNYTSGLNVNETAFYSVNAGSSVDVINKINNIPVAAQVQFREMIYRYIELTMGVTGLSGRTFNAVISDPNVSSDAKDFINLVSFSYVCNPDYLFNKLMIPKMFERVFHIPVSSENVDPFYIDFTATNKTQTGRLSLESLNLSNKIVKSTNGESYIANIDSKEAVFVDFFVVLEGNDVIV